MFFGVVGYHKIRNIKKIHEISASMSIKGPNVVQGS